MRCTETSHHFYFCFALGSKQPKKNQNQYFTYAVKSDDGTKQLSITQLFQV
jgi:hypothetical protein